MALPFATDSADVVLAMPELMDLWREALSTAAGQPVGLHRESATRFSLENGEELLLGSFSSIELKRFRGVLRVPDPSVWPQAMEIIDQRLSEIVGSAGHFEISADRGIFVCR